MDMENAYQLSVGGSEVRRITKDDTLIWQRAVEAGASESDVITPTRDSQTLGADILGECLQQETPEGITQLDGITSQDNNQYINTGVIGNSAKFKVRVEALFTEDCIPTSGNNYFAGPGTVSRMNLFIEKSRNVGYYVESSTGTADAVGLFQAELNKFYNIEIDVNTTDSTASMNATDDDGNSMISASKAYTPQTTITTAFTLFRQASTKPYAGGVKIRRATFWKNDVMVADFVACKTSDGTARMFELLGKKLYSNAGSGSFTAGDAITPTPAKPVEIQTVGDKTKNLLSTTFDKKRTNSGVTLTPNGDGTYTLNGTASSTADAKFSLAVKFDTDTTLNIFGCPSGGGSKTWDIYPWDNTTVARCKTSSGSAATSDYGSGSLDVVFPGGHSTVLTIRVTKGSTVNNLVFKPMLTTDASATYDDYEPCNKYSVPIVRYSKNVFDGVTYIETREYSNVGISFTNLGDGGVHIAGTPKSSSTISFAGVNAYGDYGLFLDGVKPGDTITIYGCVYQVTASVSGGGITSVDATNSVKTFTIPSWATTGCLAYRFTKGNTYDAVVYPVVARGNHTNLTFTPYIAPTTQKVFIDAPLRKIGDVADELVVNGNTATVTRNVGEVDSASLSWWLSSSPTRWISETGSVPNMYDIGNARGTNILAEQYPIKTDDTTPSMFQYSTRLYCYNGSETVTPTGKVIYQLATPTTETATVSGEIDLTKNTEYTFGIGTSLGASSATLKYLGEN